MPTTTNADPTTTTLPDCLARTAADDRAEAEATARRLEPGPCADHAANVRVTLSAIQRREAEAVHDAAPMPNDDDEFAVEYLAARAVVAVMHETRDEYQDQDRVLTLAQRATLLDAARALVKLALEVAG